jgi:hypothetical protein
VSDAVWAISKLGLTISSNQYLAAGTENGNILIYNMKNTDKDKLFKNTQPDYVL